MFRADIFSSIEKTLIVLLIAMSSVVAFFLVAKLFEAITGKKIETLGALVAVWGVFTVLGMVIGLITAASRVSAVGDVMPAALGLIGAVALFAVTKSPKDLPMVSAAVVSFSILLFLGTVLGSHERLRADLYAEAQKYNVERQIARAEVEFIVNAYRRSRGLEPLKDF